MPALIVLYVALYGIFRIHGFVLDQFNAGYLVILLPIWAIDGMRGSYEVFLRRRYRTSTEDLSKITVIIACKDGESVIGATIADLVRRLPAQQIIVASNGSSDRTCEIARRAGVVCLDIPDAVGKVRAINYALEYVATPYVLLLDDDTLIGGASLPTGLLDDGYDAVAFRVFVKKSSWVSYFQMYEYRKSSDIGKRRHNKGASVQNVSGAIGLFRLSELKRQVVLHTGEFSGEDLQRTLLIHLSKNRKGVVLADSVVHTEAPATVAQLYRQRVFGWFPGLYANFVNYIRIGFGSQTPLSLREDAFYNCFLVMAFDAVRLLALPILIFYPWYFVVMYITYVLLEFLPYIRQGRNRVPVWVVLLSPLYGIFGLFTRVGAFGVFLYRRSAARLTHALFLDDYRAARDAAKVVSVALVSMFMTTVLGLNIALNYSHFFTNVNVFQQLINLLAL